MFGDVNNWPKQHPSAVNHHWELSYAFKCILPTLVIGRNCDDSKQIFENKDIFFHQKTGQTELINHRYCEIQTQLGNILSEKKIH